MALRYCTECGEQWDDGNGYRPHTPWQCRENVIDRLRRQLAAANERVGELEKERGELRDEWPMFEYVDDTEGMVAIEVPETVIQNFHRILGGGK